jgi:hypothetical protein
MLAELASDLLDKVRTVPALEAKTSLTIGGKSADPDLTKIPLPAAWVVMRKEGKDTSPYDRTDMSGVVDEYTLAGIWTVTIMVPYTSDDDLIDTQYPLLESVRKAVHKTEGDIESADGSMRWAYMGMRIALVYTDRLAYEQSYHVNYATSS